MLELVAASLQLTEADTAHLRTLYTGQANQLRLLHYPAIAAEDAEVGEEKARLGAHTDWR